MASQSTKRRRQKNIAAVLKWPHPAGTPVVVRRANGATLETITESEAWLTPGGSAFVRVRGIPGNTRLARVTLKEGR